MAPKSCALSEKGMSGGPQIKGGAVKSTLGVSEREAQSSCRYRWDFNKNRHIYHTHAVSVLGPSGPGPKRSCYSTIMVTFMRGGQTAAKWHNLGSYPALPESKTMLLPVMSCHSHLRPPAPTNSHIPATRGPRSGEAKCLPQITQQMDGAESLHCPRESG